MKQPLKEIFTFSKSERRGIFVLLFIVFLLLIYDIFFPLQKEIFPNQSEFKLEVKKFLASKKKKEESNSYFSKPTIAKPKEKRKPHLKPHPFNPNTMTYKQWLEMGLSQRQAKNIENYKSKGGYFNTAEDFKKIYSISEDDYKTLSPFIIINEPYQTEFEEIIDEIDEVDILDLNTIDIEEIQSIRGIGPSFAKRIIKYRDLLGGYTSIKQLREVYGMDKERFHQISPFFEITMDSIQKLSLNRSSYHQLLRHPYISKNLAYEITSYRKNHGKFKTVDELKKISIVNDSLYERIYLYFAP